MFGKILEFFGYKSKGNNGLPDHSQDLRIARGPIDIPFMIITLMLLTLGVIMVLSASYASAYYDLNNETGGSATYYFFKQLIFALGGVGVMYIASRFSIGFYRHFAELVLGIAVVGLMAVLVVGTETNGSTRWFYLGPISIQPSEIAKIGVILVFSKMVCAYGNEMGTFKKGVLPFVIIIAVIVGLLALEPHLSASIIIITIGAIIMFVGGTRIFWFITGGVGVLGLFVVAVSILNYSENRIVAWLHPFDGPRDICYQTIQSLLAIGSGGFLGLGLGQGRQKYLYLPEEHNDFIFSVICEELGFIGAFTILLLFAMLIIRGYWLAMHCRDRYSFLVCVGLTSLLALQVILNVAVCTNLIPCTGISLPFFSYGGSALLMQMGEMGIILSISREIPTEKRLRKKKKIT